MEFSIKLDTAKSRWSIICIEESHHHQCYSLQIILHFFLVSANRAAYGIPHPWHFISKISIYVSVKSLMILPFTTKTFLQNQLHKLSKKILVY